MAVPRANLGGDFGSGVHPQQPHMIDVAGLLQAGLGGASSLIHNAYLRKVGERNYQLALRRLEQENELHKAQLEATTAYRTATLHNAQDRIAAPGARQQAQQKRAYGDLTKEFPEHTLVQPDESGQPPEFDGEGTDYVSALKDARNIKSKGDQQAYKLENIRRAAELRQQVNIATAKARADAQAKKPASSAQLRLRQNDILNRIATLSDGDPARAADIIANDKDLADGIAELGIHDYQIRAAATSLGDKKASAATNQNLKLQTSFSVPGSTPGAPATAADINSARIRLQAPRATASPTGAQPTSAASPADLPPATGNDTPAPAAAVTPLRTPGAPAQPAVPAPVAVPKLKTPGTAAAAAPLNMKPMDESAMGDADLWETKRKQGLTADAATAYVRGRKKVTAPAASTTAPAPAGGPSTLAPEEEDDNQPAGVL